MDAILCAAAILPLSCAPASPTLAPMEDRSSPEHSPAAEERPAADNRPSPDNRLSADGGGLAMRLWAGAEKTEFVIEADTPLALEKLFALEDPPRIVADIAVPAAVAGGRFEAGDIAAAGYLKNVRAARFDRDTVRVVFDLAAAASGAARLGPPVAGFYRHRLLIAVAPRDAPDPLLALLRQLEEKERAEAAPPFVVVIDPGHGGEDPGAVSRHFSGLYEKDVVLAVSRRLRDELNARPGMHALLTRDGDYFIPLAERVRRAQKIGADLFLSIHADAVESPKPRGSSVFVLSRRGASSKWARRMAAQANLSDLVGGADAGGDAAVDAALRAISRDGNDRASRLAAGLILRRLGEIGSIHGRQVEAAGFAVLKSPLAPSVLVETAFISNPDEARKLRDPAFQNQLAAQIAAAVDDYRRRVTEAE